MQQLKNFKWLLTAMAFLLCLNVSAQTTAFTQDFTAVNESTDPADYGLLHTICYF